MSTNSFSFVDHAKENLLVVWRLIEWICEIFAIFVIGTFMILVTFFPNIIRKKTDFERAEEDRLRARNQADHQERVEEFRTWCDQQDLYLAEKKSEDERIRKYNLTATKVNSALENSAIIHADSDA